MTTLLTVAAAVLAVVAAARSTWSPCGVSMLATVTPLAEQRPGPPLPDDRGVVHRGRASRAGRRSVSSWPRWPSACAPPRPRRC